jgi:hypothetical protein
MKEEETEAEANEQAGSNGGTREEEDDECHMISLTVT